jgi:hypothetical protein
VPACGCDQGGRVAALSRGPAFGDANAETREAADSPDLESCPMRFRGCMQAADVMRLISSDIFSEAAGVRTHEFIAIQHAGSRTSHWSPELGRFTIHESRFL